MAHEERPCSLLPRGGGLSSGDDPNDGPPSTSNAWSFNRELCRQKQNMLLESPHDAKELASDLLEGVGGLAIQFCSHIVSETMAVRQSGRSTFGFFVILLFNC